MKPGGTEQQSKGLSEAGGRPGGEAGERVAARQRQPYSLRHCRPLLFTRGLAHSEQLVQLEKTPGTSWCPLISFHLSFGSFVSFSFSLSFGCSLFLPWMERKTQPITGPARPPRSSPRC